MPEKDADTPRTADEEEAPRAGRRLGAAQRVRAARDQFQDITGLVPESVSGLSRADEGWQVTLEVVELARVPDTMSLLATYRVEVDSDGELLGYQRIARYARGQADR
ncbi:gas vesicle protein [Actinoalloteichus sp. AHMU CJ021]|uniref:Gas vesicle synthesis protein GvpO n=1 Tax=Actinoalloteichus caeruleus DSM 43889 TaxID=1120930 RepID=A0ABT1JI49_ACTCY